MTVSEIIYIPELATMMGKSDVAVRAMIQRGSPDVPKSFKVGRKHAWYREDARKFFAAKRAAAKKGGTK